MTNTIKKFVCVALTVMTALSAAACSKKEESSEEKLPETPAAEVLEAVVKSQTEFPESLREKSRNSDGSDKDGWQDTFEFLYDFPAEKVEDYAIIYSSVSTADEITVVRLKSAGDAEDMKKAAEKRVKERTATFENYGPEEVSKLNGALIKAEGNYCMLAISDQTAEAQKAFEEAVK